MRDGPCYGPSFLCPVVLGFHADAHMMKMLKQLLPLYITGLLALIAFVYWYERLASNTGYVTVGNCDEAGAEALRSLVKLMDDDGMRREFYDMIARSKEHRCIFFTYSPQYRLLRSGKDMYGGYTGMYRISPAQLKSFKLARMHDDALFRMLAPFEVTHVEENPPSRTMDLFIFF